MSLESFVHAGAGQQLTEKPVCMAWRLQKGKRLEISFRIKTFEKCSKKRLHYLSLSRHSYKTDSRE